MHNKEERGIPPAPSGFQNFQQPSLSFHIFVRYNEPCNATTDFRPQTNTHIKKERFIIMKKQIKVLAVLSTAMFMAAVTPNFIGTASTAYAKTVGWTEENGNWYYYDSYGEAITDTWKKNGDDWYYLDSDGIRAADRQIDEYYVGEDGKRVSMKWVSVEMKISGMRTMLLNSCTTIMEGTARP